MTSIRPARVCTVLESLERECTVLESLEREYGRCDVMCFAQVCTVFESLDREYARSEDWCASEKVGDRDKEAFMRGLVQRHNEQKEGFLKVCHHKNQ